MISSKIVHLNIDKDGNKIINNWTKDIYANQFFIQDINERILNKNFRYPQLNNEVEKYIINFGYNSKKIDKNRFLDQFDHMLHEINEE